MISPLRGDTIRWLISTHPRGVYETVFKFTAESIVLLAVVEKAAEVQAGTPVIRPDTMFLTGLS